jgi:hypothetical protein
METQISLSSGNDKPFNVNEHNVNNTIFIWPHRKKKFAHIVFNFDLFYDVTA